MRWLKIKRMTAACCNPHVCVCVCGFFLFFFFFYFCFRLRRSTRPLIPSPFSTLNKKPFAFQNHVKCWTSDSRNIQPPLTADCSALKEWHGCTLHCLTRDLTHKVNARPKAQCTWKRERRESKGVISKEIMENLRMSSDGTNETVSQAALQHVCIK